MDTPVDILQDMIIFMMMIGCTGITILTSIMFGEAILIMVMDGIHHTMATIHGPDTTEDITEVLMEVIMTLIIITHLITRAITLQIIIIAIPTHQVQKDTELITMATQEAVMEVGIGLIWEKIQLEEDSLLLIHLREADT